MKNFYHCFNCWKIPIINIDHDKVLISCPDNNKKTQLLFSDYYSSVINFNEIKSNVIKIFSCTQHKNKYYNYFCINCKINICEYCKKYHEQKSHKIFPDNIIEKKNNDLKNFINKAREKFKKIKEVLEEIEKKLDFYQIFLIDDKKIRTGETFTNLNNLNLINYINYKEKIFLNKMNEIISILNNCNNFEYQNEEKLQEAIKNEKSINREIIINNSINNINEGNSKIQDSNNKEDNKASIVNSKININDIKIDEFTNIQKIKKEILFKLPENKLYERYAIKLQDIQNKSRYIIEKIINITQNLEDNLNEKNRFLISVGQIARICDNFSKNLFDILLSKFNESNKFNTIIYEKAKIELSSWVNQCLNIDNFYKNIKDMRYFYEYYCQQENQRIEKYIYNNDFLESIFKQENFNFQNLFSILSQLYTEILIYSEKDIEIKYYQDCNFEPEKMKDVNEVGGRRIVKFTILPGIFVSNKVIKDGQLLAFCEKKNSKSEFNPDFIKLNTFELNIDNTIKKKNLENSIICNLKASLAKDIKNKIYLKLEIITKPQILSYDNPKYLVKSSNYKQISINFDENKNFIHILKKLLPKNIKLYGIVEIYGTKIKSKEIDIK